MGIALALGYGDIRPISDFTKSLVMFQLASGFLLLLCIFPLLMSRLSMYKGHS